MTLALLAIYNILISHPGSYNYLEVHLLEEKQWQPRHFL